MSYEIVITRVKKIETSLEKLGAEGRGLHEKLSSVESELDADLVKRIRFVASVRNSLLHDDNYKLTSEMLENFQNACDEVDRSIADHFEPEGSSENRAGGNSKSIDNGSASEAPDGSITIKSNSGLWWVPFAVAAVAAVIKEIL